MLQRQSLTRTKCLMLLGVAVVLSVIAISVYLLTVDKLNYRVVVLSDTQYYSSSFPETFVAQTRWIADERKRGNVDLVIHLGDVVDADVAEQWQVADNALSALDGVVPYTLVAGNHDLQWDGTRDSQFSKYFPPTRLGLAGTFEAGRSENSWQIVQVGDKNVLVLALEYWPRDDVLVWAKEVLSKHTKIPTIIATHSFLFDDGTRYGEPGVEEHPWGPAEHQRVTGYLPSDANDAEEMYQELVVPNKQVFLILSGHVLNRGVARRADTRLDGTMVNQVLQNYQMREGGGEGYLRVYEFYDERIEVKTYSPLLDSWITDDANEFSLSR